MNTNKNNSSNKWLGLLIIFFAISGFLTLRIITPEDSWICKDGEWVKHGNPSQPKPTSTCPGLENKTSNLNIESAEPQDIVQNFYNWYIQYEGNPLSSGAYKTSEYLTENFKTKLGEILESFKTGGYDPVLCAQDIPQNFTVSNSVVNNSQASVELKSFYGDSENNLKIKMEKKDKQWLINDVTCVPSSNSGKNSKTTKVIVYFNNTRRAGGDTDCGLVYGVERNINSNSTNYYQSALEQLFQGPSNSEKAQGYSSMFSSKTRSILKNLKIVGATAYVDLTDIRTLIPNASASCGSQSFLNQVEETLKHDRKITKVIFAIDGNPEDFYEWIQIGCDQKTNNCDPKPFAN